MADGHTGAERTLAERIEHLIREGGGPAEMSRSTGHPIRTLSRWAKGDSEPPFLAVVKIAEAGGVPLSWLAYGRKGDDGEDEEDGSRPDMTGIALVPRLDVRPSAGPGTVTVGELLVPTETVPFRETWLRALGIAVPNAHFLLNDGDSMFPTIHHGDLLLADRGVDRVERDGIYVFVYGGLVMVKRLQPMVDGSLLILSDNPRYKRQIVRAANVVDLRVESRIKWYGRNI